MQQASSRTSSVGRLRLLAPSKASTGNMAGALHSKVRTRSHTKVSAGLPCSNIYSIEIRRAVCNGADYIVSFLRSVLCAVKRSPQLYNSTHPFQIGIHPKCIWLYKGQQSCFGSDNLVAHLPQTVTCAQLVSIAAELGQLLTNSDIFGSL